MKALDGWHFSSADFSVQAGSGKGLGTVLLVRSPDEKARWLQMPEELREDDNGPPLYVVGCALTLVDALCDANLKAANAKPIRSYDIDEEPS